MQKNVDLLIIGAGPYGLAMAAYARHLGLDYLVVGKPMEFWKNNMPRGMILRSASDWHLDPTNVDTIDLFLATQGLKRKDVEPLSLQTYITYTQWFQENEHIEITPLYVHQLDYLGNVKRPLQATLSNSQIVRAENVVIGVGMKYFKYLPPEIVTHLPVTHIAHTCDLVEFSSLQDKRCLIFGGRQSAFEWAALLHEAGAECVHLSYRHDTPDFKPSDWSWITPMVDAMVKDPAWYRNLPEHEKEEVNHQVFVESRQKVEPWLETRVMNDQIRLHPRTNLAGCREEPGSELAVELDNGEKFNVDTILLATGYKVKMDRVPFLVRGNILGQMLTRNSFPVLDEHFQTNIPDLFITSLPASQDFGPFFGFTFSARASARLIGQAIVQ
jgi:FAD-dependent urate hydroxylase